ncbi:MAG: hypothetical protein LBV25_11525 [Chryseobacterium sp.]|jgi:RHS repeat-associated protein|nr:hypothetical protein [Chryseobacterium sp.]
MNHLKTGNAFFGRGSYKDNKYNSKELQETGMYSYGWREYMPDIARWNGIDQLAESYLSTSPYAYVANNPILMTDPDGRWMDDSGHITDTTGQTFGFLGSSYKPQGAINYLGVKYGDGGGGPAPKNSKGPGVIERFISWLFGGKKKAGRLEVGQVERISISYGQTALFGLIRNANVNANGESPLEQYRTWRDYSLYNEGENWLDRFARNVNSSHMEILQDEGSGGGLMFGGYGKTIAAAEEVSMTSKIAAEAEAHGFKSFNSGIDPAITGNYLEQMMNGTFNKPVGVAGFRWEGKFYLNEGNHRMNSAIQYKILTGDYKYMDILMNNAKWDNANPVNYGKIYKFPVKPTR